MPIIKKKREQRGHASRLPEPLATLPAVLLQGSMFTERCRGGRRHCVRNTEYKIQWVLNT